jgi:hypothetical protein
MTAPLEDGWIEWNGGACPVSAGAKVYVRFRDGDTDERLAQPETASFWIWQHGGSESDIIAYRVVQS